MLKKIIKVAESILAKNPSDRLNCSLREKTVALTPDELYLAVEIKALGVGSSDEI